MKKVFDVSDSFEGDLIFSVRLPRTTKRYNPYMADDEQFGEHDTVCGLVDKSTGEWGFSFVIDMSYKGKDDQFSSPFLDASSFITEEEFHAICKEHNIPVVIYESRSED